MSKIYDALEHARKERADIIEPPLHAPTVSLPVQAGRAEVDMEQEMISLYQTITASLPMDHPSVLFVGSRSNEGTSTVARQLARTVSLRLQKSVLLIDLDRSRPDLHVYVTSKKTTEDEDEPPKTGRFNCEVPAPGRREQPVRDASF